MAYTKNQGNPSNQGNPARGMQVHQSLMPERDGAGNGGMPGPAELVSYQDLAGNRVELSMNIVRDALGIGNRVTDLEAYNFLNLCRFRRLNPFTHEVYLVKYGDKAQTVVGIDTFKKRAQRNPAYQGMRSGVIVVDANGEIQYRKGEFYLLSDQLAGAWCEVYVKDYTQPVTATVNLREYMQMKDGRPTKNWADKPATMIHKVAMSHALRDAFSDDMADLYEASEMGVEEPGDTGWSGQSVRNAGNRAQALDAEFFNGTKTDAESVTNGTGSQEPGTPEVEEPAAKDETAGMETAGWNVQDGQELLRDAFFGR